MKRSIVPYFLSISIHVLLGAVLLSKPFGERHLPVSVTALTATPLSTAITRSTNPSPGKSRPKEAKVKETTSHSVAAHESPTSTTAVRSESGTEAGPAQIYIAELRQALETLKRYPAGARALRQAGRVEVGFTLKKNGEIIDVHVIQPSPFKRLDDAAVQTVLQLGKYKPLPDTVSTGDWKLALPMDFVLD